MYLNPARTLPLALLCILAVLLQQGVSAVPASDDLNNSNCDVNGNCPAKQSEESERSLTDTDDLFKFDGDDISSPLLVDPERMDGIKRTQILITNGEYDKAAEVLTDELYHAHYTDDLQRKDEAKVGIEDSHPMKQ